MTRRRSFAFLLATGLAILILASRLSPPVLAQPQTTALSQVEEAFATVQAAEEAGANVTGLDAMLNQALGLIVEGTALQSANQSEAQLLFAQAEATAASVTSDAKVAMTMGQAAGERNVLLLGGELVVIGLGCILLYLYVPRVYWRVWARINRDSKVSPP